MGVSARDLITRQKEHTVLFTVEGIVLCNLVSEDEYQRMIFAFLFLFFLRLAGGKCKMSVLLL